MRGDGELPATRLHDDGVGHLARTLNYVRLVSYVTDGMQKLSQGGGLGAVELDLVWLAGWAVVLLIAAGRVFRWD